MWLRATKIGEQTRKLKKNENTVNVFVMDGILRGNYNLGFGTMICKKNYNL